MTDQKILIIEDDPNILTGLIDNLAMEGYKLKMAIDGKQGLQIASDTLFDLIILDIMLPLMDGFEVCRQIRAKGITTPIIVLSAKGEEFDKILGLELGADDYIAKPFSPREFLMRVKAVLRRSSRKKTEAGLDSYETRDIKINFVQYEVTKKNKPVKLTVGEFTILKLLIQNRGEPVSRHKMMAAIWGTGITSRAVDTHIWNLREKLEDNPAKPNLIVTVQRIGYKFVE